jgi:hypothetical protein
MRGMVKPVMGQKGVEIPYKCSLRHEPSRSKDRGSKVFESELPLRTRSCIDGLRLEKTYRQGTSASVFIQDVHPSIRR